MKTIKNNAIIIENDIFHLSTIVALSYESERLYVYLHTNKSHFYPMSKEKSKYYFNLYKSTFDKVYV